jgi:hypothetical protein
MGVIPTITVVRLSDGMLVNVNERDFNDEEYTMDLSMEGVANTAAPANTEPEVVAEEVEETEGDADGDSEEE